MPRISDFEGTQIQQYSDEFFGNFAADDAYNSGTYESNRIEDGLGHYWDSSIQDWRNLDGSRYSAAQSSAPYSFVSDYSPAPDPFANFNANDAYNMGRYEQSGYDVPVEQPDFGQPLQEQTDASGNRWVDDPAYPGGGYWLDRWGNTSLAGTQGFTSPTGETWQNDQTRLAGGGWKDQAGQWAGAAPEFDPYFGNFDAGSAYNGAPAGNVAPAPYPILGVEEIRAIQEHDNAIPYPDVSEYAGQRSLLEQANMPYASSL